MDRTLRETDKTGSRDLRAGAPIPGAAARLGGHPGSKGPGRDRMARRSGRRTSRSAAFEKVADIESAPFSLISATEHVEDAAEVGHRLFSLLFLAPKDAA